MVETDSGGKIRTMAVQTIGTPEGSALKKGRGRPAWLKPAILWGLILLATYGVIALEAKQKGDLGSIRATTYSTAARGYKALYLWLQALNVPIERWSRPLYDLPVEASTVLIAEPEVGPDRGEMKALDHWVKTGGTLVMVMGTPNVFFEYFGLGANLIKGKNHKEKVLFQPSPYTGGVLTVNSKGHLDLHSDRPEWVFHLRDGMGGLLAVMNHGKGRVIALSDTVLLSNGSLREGDHAVLALNLLLTHRREGSILVDEYHHGYGRATSVFGHLGRSWALVPFLQGILLFLILWAGIGRRFGPPRSPIMEDRQSSMAYFRAIGQLFQRAGARKLALETSIRWIQEESKTSEIDGDSTLKKKIQTLKANLKSHELTDRELLLEVRGFYEALEAARGKVQGK
jgi:hypothetical protein